MKGKVLSKLMRKVVLACAAGITVFYCGVAIGGNVGDLEFKSPHDDLINLRSGGSSVVVNNYTKLRKNITGVVISEFTRESLPGVNVRLVGTNIGTVTDVNGRFSIEVEGTGDQLEFSYIGYENTRIAIGNQSSLEVYLKESNETMEEVVVVGYGVQKKVNLTGAVSSVDTDDLVKRPVTNVQNMLQGKIPGLQIVQNTGQPGSEGSVMRLRGVGTFSSAGNNPLVLVDGIQGNLSDLDPNNVASISVLKDAASASIYGARAANGVILVTTKNGQEGEFSLQYSGNFQLHEPTRMPKLVTNSADFMSMWNFANERAGLPKYFSPEEIENFRNATDPAKYPNYDWMGNMIKPSFAHNHNITASGGNNGTTYNFSLGYVDQKGVLPSHKAQRYNFRVNVDSRINDKINFGGKVALVRKNMEEPIWHNQSYMLMIYGAGPNYTPYLSDGSGRFSARYNSAAWHNRNPLAQLDAGSRRGQDYSVAAQTYVDVELLDGLTWGVKGAINLTDNFFKHHEFAIDNYFFNDNTYAHDNWPGNLGVSDQSSQGLLTTLYSTLNYSKTFNNHHLSALIGYNQESYTSRSLGGRRVNFPVTYLKELDAGASNGQSLSGTSSEWAIQSLFGRLNYSYKEKYLLEGNFRYDGTSRIHKDNRWGVFPSISAGWRLSEESFLKGLMWMDNLKLRASWGQLGNQNIGLYPYQDILSLTAYPFNSSLDQGVVSSRLTDKTLKWETTTISNIGLDYGMYGGMFTLGFEWFNKVTDDILYGIQIPASVGLSSPTTNFASMKNTGIELEMGHQNNTGDFQYGVNFNVSTFRNEVLRVKSPSYGTKTIQEGLPWNSHYLIEWIGIFQDEEDIANSPTHPFNPKPGDLKFKDISGPEGQPDGIINADDRKVVEGAYPDFIYGGTINASWRNFDLSAFFQGVKGQKYYVNLWGVDPFIQGAPPTREFADNAWTLENPTNKYPAMYTQGYGPVTGTPSTYYLKDASYLRLKNLVIGYTVPDQLVERIGLKSARVFLSGDNLLTFTKYPGADPERTGDGWFVNYPQIRIYSLGVKVKL